MDKDKQIQKKKKKELTHLEQVASQIKEQVITKSNCKLCNSKYRSEAETLYEKTNKNIRAVEKLLVVTHNESISYQAIRNHFKTHYEQQKMDLQVKEYIDNIAKYRVEHVDRRSSLEERKLMLEQHMVNLAAMGQGSTSSEEMRKDANALKSLSDAILAIDKELTDMDRKMEPVFVVIKILEEIVKEKIKATKDHAHKADLTDVLVQLSAQTEDIIVER